ncbi:Uma2 family endonuclease [Actinomadura parmotrematis]|uniref:Uma2 family endonuclease n=1 Tax=Actinomadura parmotrematis TaxID=2864039 RepID=A0ABS7FS91_9ACTN|nr:Uma2 family endonuclease [Actinomadura parmotrematis]MBW8483275.1 Uma2 family endonuclease [Actinomadura parmotrematis]
MDRRGPLAEHRARPRRQGAGARPRDEAAAAAGADVYVKGPLDIKLGPTYRVPDLAVVHGPAARDARARRARAYDAADVLLIAEIVSPRSSSERTGRVDKVFEYAQAGIPRYWLIDLEPEPCVVVRELADDGRYHVTGTFTADLPLTATGPFACELDPAALLD